MANIEESLILYNLNDFLRLVCIGDHLDILEFMVSNGANINMRDNRGQSCLMLVCIVGHINIVKFLVSKGANIHEKDNDGWNCLMKACIYGHFDIVEFLVSHTMYALLRLHIISYLWL